MPQVLISAAHKSSGKTTVCIGLAAALRQRNFRVQTFKKGPDYIDPMWLTQASGRSCYNLDFYTQSHEEIRNNFNLYMRQADLGIIEGNKGLYDGLDLHGSNSNAALAKLLGAPVILVIDSQGMTRGIAPLLLGYQAFDANIRIAGVIFNKVGGARHESKLRQVVQYYTDLTIVGSVQRASELELIERHLGLMPSNEAAEPLKQIATIRSIISKQVDLDLLNRLANQANAPTIEEYQIDRHPITELKPIEKSVDKHPHELRIGIAMDAAFGFYYPGDLEAMESHGAKLIPFSPMHDQALPNVDGLFIGGGFPEACMQELEANSVMRQAIAAYVEAGKPVYAECGGLMYLARSISWNGQTCAMVGVIPADAVMYKRPQGRGYVQLRATKNYPWDAGGDTDKELELAAHEFHYSRLEKLDSEQVFAFEVLRGDGIDGKHDGIVYKNLLAGFTHLRDVAGYHWTKHFIDHVQRCNINRYS